MTDPSGAHVVNAIVVALNVSTGVRAPVQTNEAGVYTMPSLQPGKYTFTAEHAGFRKAVLSDVELQVGTVLTLNMTLEIGSTTETVEVHAAAIEVNATSSSVGEVVEGKRLLDLPLAGRSAYDLLITQPGVQGSTGTNFYLNGNQGGSINFTMDGINAQNNLLTGSFYLYSNVVSTDRAEEFRVVTSAADAEYGRGSGQVQMVTRGGGNTFHGAGFSEVRNGIFNANTFINNALGVDAAGHERAKRDQLKQNNYGVRVGGPVKRNKTFFNGIWEPYKQRNNGAFTATVLTPAARQGIFRFFPGVQNGNTTAGTPTVDPSGNPLAPAGATLQSVPLFGRDPNRMVIDPTGNIGHILSLMPSPNNYQFGDGLNTAGFTWNRPVPVNFELYEGRVDHIFNEKHRIAITANHQSYHSFNVAANPPWPSIPGQADPTETTQYSLALTSVLRPNLLNDLRVGAFRPRTVVQTPWEVGQNALTGSDDARKALLPTVGGLGFVPQFASGITNPIAGQPSNYIAPVYQWGDSLTWIKGKHSFKGGFEIRFISDSGYDANNTTARVFFGANTTAPATNITSGNAIAGIGANGTLATNILYDLTGTVGNGSTQGVFQTNYSPGGANPRFLPGETRFREWHQNEFSWFFKDDWKITPSLTLNLGIRWEFYQPPTEGQGKMVAPVGGGAGLFGVSGTNIANGEFQPGVFNGSPTQVQIIGPGTGHDIAIYQSDKNNFAPAVGLAYTVPGTGFWKWLSGGPNQMTIRAGYGIGYQRLPIYLTHNNAGLEPGLSEDDRSFPVNLGAATLPVPPAGVPLAVVPQVGGLARQQTLYAFDEGLRTPYAQNYNFTISRALHGGVVMNLAFVGSKGSKLARSININEFNIFENGILAGFKTVQAGGDSPLLDQLLAPLGASGVASGKTIGSTVQSFFANNNPGGLAGLLDTTLAGALLAASGKPTNFIAANPQYLAAFLVGNYGNSTYNSLQVEVNKRFAKGFTAQGSYVWSHTLGDSEGDSSVLVDSFRTIRNESIDKRSLSYDFQSVLKMNGLYELPFGKGKLLGRNSNGFLDRIIGGWQLGAVAIMYSGAPLAITGQNTFNATPNVGAAGGTSYGFTPNLVGTLPGASVTKTGKNVVLIPGITSIVDPASNVNPAVQAFSTLRAIVDASGKPILVNAAPGQLGNLPFGYIRGPGAKSLNLNLIKRIKINERFTAQIGATAQNATNTPIFANPTSGNLNINSTTFGVITSATGARLIVLQGRLTF
ncbi:MAG TPA: TonB-dependent receptor [Bryobacteraceae bacterium]|nr:TonB-dependent receptor [Bryobacteraceae bacterium]